MQNYNKIQDLKIVFQNKNIYQHALTIMIFE